MSLILFVEAGKDSVMIRQMHYREAIGRLRSCVIGDEEKLVSALPTEIYLDGGYIIVDKERKTIVSRQDCFSITEVVKRDEHWNVVDLLL